MKEMEYSNKRGREVLYCSVDRGFEFYVMSLGNYPVAYVNIPKTHPFYGKFYMDLPPLTVHGGITYSDNELYLSKKEKIPGWFIGWDYNHFGDYDGFEESLSESFKCGGKKWTISEILDDVRAVITQLFDYEHPTFTYTRDIHGNLQMVGIRNIPVIDNGIWETDPYMEQSEETE